MGILMELGRYDEAWAMHLVDRGGAAPLGLAVATGHWHDAADVIATAAGDEPVCQAALFRAFAGDRDPFAAIAQLCPVYVILAGPPAQWVANLAWRHGATDLLIDRVELALGVTQLDQAIVANDLVGGLPALPWLARVVPPAAHGESTASALRAIADVEAGDFPAARTELARADLIDPVRTAIANDIALHEGAPVGAPTVNEPQAIEVRRGELVSAGTRECDNMLEAAFAEASDAGPLVRALETCNGSNWQLDELALAVAARFTSHRAELASELRVRPVWQMRGLALPTVLVAAALRRDVARLVGDTAEAARWQSIVARHAKVLEDPRKAVAFMALGD